MPVGEGLAVKQVVCFCAIPQQQSLEENKSTTQTNKKRTLTTHNQVAHLAGNCLSVWSVLANLDCLY